jgi:hypothetical protein
MKRIAWLVLIALPCFADLTTQQRSWMSHASRRAQDGWTIVHIEGEPRVRGFQHGYLLANEIADGIRMRRTEWEHDSGMDWTWLVGMSRAMFKSKVDAEDFEEIAGIGDGMAAAGVKTSVDELIAYNGYFDLAWYWWPIYKKKLDSDSPNPPHQSCSSFIATGKMTADGSIVLGHNTMFEYPAATANVILDIVPMRGHRLVMQIFAGWIHSGTDFFMNDAGIIGSETTIGGFDGFDETGVPEFVRMRRATQDASTIDEWAAIMRKGNNGGYANAWLLGDIKTNEIARLELGLKNTPLQRTKDGYFTGSNVAEDRKLLRFETNTHDTDIRSSPIARRVRWNQLMRENAGKIDVAKGEAFEADHYDTMLNQEHAGGRTLCGHSELEGPEYTHGEPWSPGGTFDGKVIDTAMAKSLSFAARWGSACGRAFDATQFLAAHPQYEWMRDILPSRPSEPWTIVRVK